MKLRHAAGRFFGYGAAAMLSLAGTSCGNRNPDINTVQPGFVKKSFFLTDDEWYIRRTISKAETTNAYAVEGSGDLWLDRVKFKIEENWLLAYRPHEAVPGSQDEEFAGKKGFEGSVIAAWPITDHFDIVRDYDPQTGNEANTIGENTSDKPWFDRQYMRINWAANALDGTFSSGWGVNEFPIYFISSATQWKDPATSPTDPDVVRVTEDYIEVNNNVFLGMDIYTCAEFVGFSGDAYGNCGYGEAKMRTSFVKMKPSDYVPHDFPDSYVVKDPQTGKPQYDEETGEVKREPMYDRFGFFRSSLPTYDRGYGTTESGRLFRTYTFNLWKKWMNADGNMIAPKDREPNPVIYYLNSEFPPRWRQAAREVAAEYNRVLRQMVADIKGVQANDPSIPDMYEIRDNDCNAGNIKSFVSNNPDYTFAVTRAVCEEGSSCDNPLDQIGIGNLDKVCTSLENATRDPATGTPKFDWQRIGDARYKMLVWLSNPQQSGWGGYGPMHADWRTGETVSATAFLRGYEYENLSAELVDMIELINDEKTVEDVIYGQDVRKHIANTLRLTNNLSEMKPGKEFIRSFNEKMDRIGTSREQLLKEVDPNFQKNRMKRIEGTNVETALISDLDLELASMGKWRPGQTLTEDIKKAASPVNRQDHSDPLGEVKARTRKALTNAGFCDLKEDLEPHYAGLALELKNMSREQRYEIITNREIKHVMLHELGHNFGFSHNFEGSYDALNYWDKFWQLDSASAEDKIAQHYDEQRNSSVMEYMSAKGLFSDHLGKYDEAAIRFGYANQVAVFNKAQLTGDEKTTTWKSLKQWRYNHDYRELPDHLCGGTCGSPDEKVSVITDRKWVDFDPQSPPQNEVPFLFCDNTYDRRYPSCATFDYGSNLKEIQANYYHWWRDYFFFNNFIRDRVVPISWSPFFATVPLAYAMYNTTLVGQYLYYYRALDANFLESGLGQDMLVTVAQGLNMAAEVMSTPEPIRMCPWPGTGGTGGPQIYIPWYYINNCDENAAIDSDYAKNAQAIQIPLGEGRPTSIGFTNDFVDYDISFMGSYFDKSDVMMYIGRNRPQFYRFNYDIDRRNYQISLFRLFEGEFRNFYDKLINLDPYLIDQSTATDLGSFWCRDPNALDVASMGTFTPRQMIDPETGAAPTGMPSSCRNPAFIYPALLRNMPFNAMYYAYALYSSPLDTELDMGKSMKVFVVGSDDEYPDWRNLPANQICSVVDILTGLEYRAIHQPAGIPDIACRLITRTQEAQVNYLQDESSDYGRERWRSWFERLEFARDLGRIYDR